jgi:transposase
MEALIMAFARTMPVSELARLLGVSEGRVWTVIDHHVEAARSKESFEDVSALGVDETATKRGQHYMTLFYDLDGKRLLFGTEGRDQTTFEPFLADFAAHGGKVENIQVAAIDMSKAYQAGLRTRLPAAEICFDPFHLAQLVHDALDQVRRTEARTETDLKGTRWALLKDAGKHTRKQINTLHWIQRSGLKTARAWKLKERFRDILQLTGDEAASALKAWISWARRCRLEPFKRVGATLKAHFDGIVNALRYRRHNGAVENMNGQIQAAKTRARGYGTLKHLLNIAYLICGKLRHLPANPFNTAKATVA